MFYVNQNLVWQIRFYLDIKYFYKTSYFLYKTKLYYIFYASSNSYIIKKVIIVDILVSEELIQKFSLKTRENIFSRI